MFSILRKLIPSSSILPKSNDKDSADNKKVVDSEENIGVGYDRIVGIDGSLDDINYEKELRKLAGGDDDDDDDDDDEDGEQAEQKKRKRNTLLERLVPPNFGSRNQLNGDGDGQIILKATHKKDLYLDLTAIFSIGLLIICAYEMIMLIHFEQTTIFARFLLSLLIFHVGSIYTFILSFIYANECGLVTNYYLSILYGTVAILAFILRAIFEIQYGPFFPASIKGFV